MSATPRSSSRHPRKVVVIAVRQVVFLVHVFVIVFVVVVFVVQAEQQPHHRQHRVGPVAVETGPETRYPGTGSRRAPPPQR